MKLNPRDPASLPIVAPTIEDRMQRFYIDYQSHLNDSTFDIALMDVYVELSDEHRFKPVLTLTITGIYPVITKYVFKLTWCRVQDRNEIPRNINAVTLREGVTLPYYHQYKMQSVGRFDPIMLDFTWEKAEEFALNVWRTKWQTNDAKFKAHNYLLNEGFDISRILKATVYQGKVFVSYLFKNGKKGSTILSLRKLESVEETHLTYVPNPSLWHQEKGAMVFLGYRIRMNNDFVGYVVSYNPESCFTADYIFIKTKKPFVQDPDEKPSLIVDENYIYAPSSNWCIYDAIFNKSEHDSTVISGNIVPDDYTMRFKKAAEAKGFGQYVPPKSNRTKVQQDTDPMYDENGNDLNPYAGTTQAIYEENESEIEDTEL